MNKRKWVNIIGFVILCFAYLIAYFHRTSTTIMTPNLMEEFKLVPEMVGIFSSMYFYPYMLMQIPSGIMSDRWGTYRVSGLFMLLSGIGTFLISWGNNFYLAILGRLFVGIGMACIYIPTLKLASTVFPKKYYLLLSSTLFACGNFGGIVGSSLLVALITKYGWRNSLGLIGAATVISSLVLLVVALIADKSKEATEKIKNEFSIIDSLKTTFFYPGMIPYYITSFLTYGSIMSFQGVWGVPYLMKVLNFDYKTAGTVIMMVSVGIIIVGPFTGWISNFIKSRKKLTMAGVILITLSFALLAFIPIKHTSFSLNSIALLMGMGMGINGPSRMTQIKETFSSELTGVVSGNNNFFTMAGGAIIPTVIGIVIGRFSGTELISESGFEIAFKLLFLLCVISFIATIYTKETYGVSAKVSMANYKSRIVHN